MKFSTISTSALLIAAASAAASSFRPVHDNLQASADAPDESDRRKLFLFDFESDVYKPMKHQFRDWADVGSQDSSAVGGFLKPGGRIDSLDGAALMLHIGKHHKPGSPEYEAALKLAQFAGRLENRGPLTIGDSLNKADSDRLRDLAKLKGENTGKKQKFTWEQQLAPIQEESQEE